MLLGDGMPSRIDFVDVAVPDLLNPPSCLDAAPFEASASTCDGGSIPQGAKRVFAASVASGNLKLEGNGPTGIEGADAVCRRRAQYAGLGGTWAAWLSTSQIDAIDRIHSDGPWYRMDGCLAVTAKKNLQGYPLVPIDRDQSGGWLLPTSETSPLVMTGTCTGGYRSPQSPELTTCTDWAGPGSAIVGIPDRAHWTEYPMSVGLFCGAVRPNLYIYCFEQ